MTHKEISDYILSKGGNEVDVEVILEDVRENGFTTMEQVKEHVENYYC